MKSLIAFSHLLLDDLQERCGVCAPRDHKTITSRVEHEGLSFLTITLPSFAKDFERSLADGRIGDDLFLGFAKRGRIPKFLGCFLHLVFDPCTGLLLERPSWNAVYSVRQFCLAFQKLHLDCTPERVQAAFDSYVKCEQDVRETDRRIVPLLPRVTSGAGVLFSSVFTVLERELASAELLPRHGPGTTAESILGNQKWTLKSWTRRLNRSFPLEEYAIPSHRYWQELQSIDILEPRDELPVRVVAVPKTLKTPRIIAIEPVCVQYAQQALGRRLVELIEGDNLLSPLIGFTDQLPNQEMARQGSISGDLATLDLSEASDRVSNQLVRALSSRFRFVREAFQDVRSQKADVPGHGVLRLAKFASMGSAVCFPVEAMVFLTIVLDSIAEQLNRPLSRELVRELHGRVRVYGDDIIVPSTYAPGVASSLESFGLKVNGRKSFWTGSFRESCGGDFFEGRRVTPVRVREKFPVTLKDVAQLESATSLRNQCYALGLMRCTEWLDLRLSRILTYFPVLPPHSPGLGRHDDSPVIPERFSATLHVPMVKARVAVAKPPLNSVEGHGALLKFFLERGEEPLSKDAFSRSGRSVSARITTQWLPV